VPFPSTDFDALSERVASVLASAGFAPAQTERSSAFGSHYSDFANGAKVYRLVWDGKESWLVLQYCDDVQSSVPSIWSDVALFRVGREYAPKAGAGVDGQLFDALGEHVSSRAA